MKSYASWAWGAFFGMDRNDPPSLPAVPGRVAMSHSPSVSGTCCSITPSIQAGAGSVANPPLPMAANHSGEKVPTSAERPASMAIML
jgi:hypothetical protein